jgi:hypothetical protein
MRADMFKVIVERPRWGHRRAESVKLKKGRHQDIKHIGLKRHAAQEARFTKSLNENLAPLIRFLRSKRGQKWNDVFSEICVQLDTGSTVKMHVREHLNHFVAHPISIGRHGEWMVEGKVLGADPWFRRQFFVDPYDGILKDQADLPREWRND